MAEEIFGNLYFQLKLDGREGVGLFTEATGGGSEKAIIEQKVHMPTGSVAIKKIPGNLKFNDLTLKRGVDPDKMLWDWRQQDVDGKFKEARCNGSIQMLASSFMPVATYVFEH